MQRLHLVLLALLVAHSSVNAQPVRQLSSIVLDLGSGTEDIAREIAREQAAMKWGNMDQGPLYKSTPLTENNDPNVVTDSQRFVGLFVPRSATSKLAVFSDDGCDVFINGQKVLSNYKVGQHLPNVDNNQSFKIITYPFVANRRFHITVHYSNTIFTGSTDIDGVTLFAFNGGGQAVKEDMLTIYFPQRGFQVPQGEKATVGSFTLVNINDTNGNGIPDIFETNVIVTQSLLTADVNQATTIMVKDTSTFPDLVNGTRNRVRVKDNSSGELAYEKGQEKGALDLVDALGGSYKANNGGVVEVGEIDLVKLVINPPKNIDKQVKSIALKVAKGVGYVKFWESENKIKEIVPNKDGNILIPVDTETPANNKPTTLWLEAVIKLTEAEVQNKSLPTDAAIATQLNAVGVRGVEIHATYGKAEPDIVTFTPVWSYKTNFWTTAKVVGKAKTLNGDATTPNMVGGQAQEAIINKAFEQQMSGDLGMGIFTSDVPRSMDLFVGGRQQVEFTLLPKGVGKEKYVVAGCARQIQVRGYTFSNGFLKLGFSNNFPIAKGEPLFKIWNNSETATDTSNEVATDPNASPPTNPSSQDDRKLNDHIYDLDGPSGDVSKQTDYVIGRFTLRQYTRFKFGLDLKFGQFQTVVIQGSRGSVLGSRGAQITDWHVAFYVKRGYGSLAPNMQKPGPISSDKTQAYVPDLDVVSASTPQYNGDGPVADVTTPNLKDKTLSDKVETRLWSASFDADKSEWKLFEFAYEAGQRKQTNAYGPFALKDNKWTISASAGGNTLLSFVIPKAAYKNGEFFRFSTYRSTAKLLEVKEGFLDVTTEDKEYEKQTGKKP